jgi:hypothetical protein
MAEKQKHTDTAAAGKKPPSKCTAGYRGTIGFIFFICLSLYNLAGLLSTISLPHVGQWPVASGVLRTDFIAFGEFFATDHHGETRTNLNFNITGGKTDEENLSPYHRFRDRNQ